MGLETTFVTLNGRIPSRKADGVAVIKTCSAFAEAGLEVELVLPAGRAASLEALGAEGSIWDFYSVPENFEITYLPGISHSWLGDVVFAVLAVTLAIARGSRLFYARSLELACLGALCGKTTVLEIHDFLRGRQRRIFPYWLKIVRNPKQQVAMVVTSQAARTAYVELGVPGERILVAPNGVDPRRFESSISKLALRRSLGLPEDRTIVGFSGHLYVGRGIERVLECAKALEQLFFVIVGGEPEDVGRCRAFAERLGASNVKFVGFVPQANVPAWLLACDILVMPDTEAAHTHNNRFRCPMKMFDYLASGRPIVATDFPVVREVLHDKRNAILVPQNSSRDLALGIGWLLDHPELASKLGEQAREDARQYSWENRTRRIVSWLSAQFSLEE